MDSQKVKKIDSTMESPFDFLRYLLEERVRVICKDGRSVEGELIGFDDQPNLFIKDVVEVQKTIQIDEEFGGTETKTETRHFSNLFIRANTVRSIACMF
ncbi:hypothetical protein ADUPG1_006770 [Aduncisulcus paluster]|uniref:Sm domain-containing protein n=1 Tax=Aduncisulcus paluster TaxID=2918883 RepID=A0ABQ5KJI0_9EUKA|nr:hypothetical protein ADUPG1_006770 [Aduncisulcus paluster]